MWVRTIVLRHMVNFMVTETQPTSVPRPREPPLPDELLEHMVPNRCYVVADLVVDFEEEYDPSRGTVRNRLEYLVKEDDVERIKHENGTVTYRRVE
jgi:hypothetical protein